MTPEERAEIDEEAAHYPYRRSVGLDAMRIVQRHRGWVSDEALEEVAEYVGVPPAELEGVATFYNLLYRKPVGRHVILVCDSVSCWIMGCDRLRRELSARLGIQPGQTSPDNRFTLLPIVCLGACDRAPVMMVDEDTHFDVTPEGVDRILDTYK